MAFEATDEGYLAKILIPAGSQEVPIGKPIAVIVEDESNVSAFANYVPQETAPVISRHAHSLPVYASWKKNII